jgi:hypothetical protein
MNFILFCHDKRLVSLFFILFNEQHDRATGRRDGKLTGQKRCTATGIAEQFYNGRKIKALEQHLSPPARQQYKRC